VIDSSQQPWLINNNFVFWDWLHVLKWQGNQQQALWSHSPQQNRLAPNCIPGGIRPAGVLSRAVCFFACLLLPFVLLHHLSEDGEKCMEQACITTTQHMLLMKSIFIINMQRQERQFSKSSVSEEVCLSLSRCLACNRHTKQSNSSSCEH
jgi:hypothetical protein